MEQRDADWFAKRAGKFTGSRFNDLMAKTKTGPAAARKNLIVQLAIERITEACVETYSNAAMQRGIDLEPEARFAYETLTGELVDEEAFIQHPELEYVGVSPDGLIGDEGMIEIKCPSSMAKHWEALSDATHAREYRWQIQGQLWVAQRQWCDATSYDLRYPEGLQLAIKRVERDEKAIADLEAECKVAHDEVNEIVEKMRQIETPAAA